MTRESIYLEQFKLLKRRKETKILEFKKFPTQYRMQGCFDYGPSSREKILSYI